MIEHIRPKYACRRCEGRFTIAEMPPQPIPRGLGEPGQDGALRPTEVGCWAHARRKFVEAQTSDALRSRTAVAMIRLLYEVEAAARELNSADRRAMRLEHSV